MITFIREITNVTSAGWEFARKINQWIREHQPEIKGEFLESMSGKLYTGYWVAHFTSLAEWEAQENKRLTDPSWAKLLKDAGPGPFWSGTNDYFYRQRETT
jgi:hypothetical protein